MGWRDSLLRFWNFWPPFLFTGIKIEQLSDNYCYCKVRLKLRFWNANYVGTQYGGSIYSMSDPFFMIMLMKNLGNGFIVWDKAAHISYLKPGNSDLTAEFVLSEEDIKTIRETLKNVNKMEWSKVIEIKGEDEQLVARVEKVISIKKR